MVLGVDWLRKLGTIKWNFMKLSMHFIMCGREFTLQGLRKPDQAVEEDANISKVTLTEGKGIWLLVEVMTTRFHSIQQLNQPI